MTVIDFECDTPTKEAVEDTIRLINSGRGFDKEGYAQLMAPGWAAQIGMSLAEFNEAKKTIGLTGLALKLCEVSILMIGGLESGMISDHMPMATAAVSAAPSAVKP